MNAAASQDTPLVGIIMGSQSDWATLEHTANMLKQLGVPFEAEVVSAHRTPDRLFEYAEQARDRGIQVIIAGAGGAAHLPGMCAAKTDLPVLGVPVKSSILTVSIHCYRLCKCLQVLQWVLWQLVQQVQPMPRLWLHKF